MFYCAVCVDLDEYEGAVVMIDGTSFCYEHAKKYIENKGRFQDEYNQVVNKISQQLDSET